MKTIVSVFEEAVRQGPGEVMECATPWAVGMFVALVVGLMAYAWWVA